MDYYRVLRDRSVTDLSFLGEPSDSSGQVDARRFTRGEPFGTPAEVLTVPIVEPGMQVDFAFGAFDLPVVSTSLGQSLRAFAPESVELVPAVVGNVERDILNVLDCIDCIDEQRTVGEKWPADTLRSDRVGQYRTVVHLFLDESRIGGRHIFRVAGWRVALVISEALARHVSADEVLGLHLVPVT